jgi:hypothetical protein
MLKFIYKTSEICILSLPCLLAVIVGSSHECGYNISRNIYCSFLMLVTILSKDGSNIGYGNMLVLSALQ